MSERKDHEPLTQSIEMYTLFQTSHIAIFR